MYVRGVLSIMESKDISKDLNIYTPGYILRITNIQINDINDMDGMDDILINEMNEINKIDEIME